MTVASIGDYLSICMCKLQYGVNISHMSGLFSLAGPMLASMPTGTASLASAGVAGSHSEGNKIPVLLIDYLLTSYDNGTDLSHA